MGILKFTKGNPFLSCDIFSNSLFTKQNLSEKIEAVLGKFFVACIKVK